MSLQTPEQRQRARTLDRSALEAMQLERLKSLLADLKQGNSFYQQKLQSGERSAKSGAQNNSSLTSLLQQLPFTNKEELAPTLASQPLAAHHSFSPDQYVRYHQTSGTHGKPLVIADTADDWHWWINCWQYVLDAADVTAEDRVFCAFSFGPFIGFWSAFDAVVARGTLAVPGGGMSSLARLEMIERSGATVLLCTPTYAMHLAEVAAEHQIDCAKLPIKKIIVAGEPGGSLPEVRERIETVWQARLTDHSGATEVGAWGFSDVNQRGLHVLETEFIAEFQSLETGEIISPNGELSQLILTSLGRTGCPLIRYQTGDVVRPVWSTDGPCKFVLLDGGILGRADDMMIVRGVNVFPSSIEQIVRSFPEVVEFRMTVSRRSEMDALLIEVEDRLQEPKRIAERLQLQLGLAFEVRLVPAMTLPRSEGKSRRFVDLRRNSENLTEKNR